MAGFNIRLQPTSIQRTSDKDATSSNSIGSLVSQEEQQGSIYALNWYSIQKQHSGNIQFSLTLDQGFVRLLHGFDQVSQLLSYSKINRRKFVTQYHLFFRLFSYRQVDGYYFYQLCKMLH